MHDIKYIRNNFSEFKKQVNNRNTEVNLDKATIKKMVGEIYQEACGLV